MSQCVRVDPKISDIPRWESMSANMKDVVETVSTHMNCSDFICYLSEIQRH